MVVSYGASMEKVTFNIPIELKEQVTALKNDLQVSFSAIYNEAIANYIQQKEIEKWQKGIDLALKDAEYMALTKELGSDDGELYEY